MDNALFLRLAAIVVTLLIWAFSYVQELINSIICDNIKKLNRICGGMRFNL